MNDSETQKYGLFLKKLTTEQIEKLLATVLNELRRRDSDTVKGDVMANSQALRGASPPNPPATSKKGAKIMGVS